MPQNRQPPRITRQLAFTIETFETFYNKIYNSYYYLPIIINVPSFDEEEIG
jgi:hypothetical protein